MIMFTSKNQCFYVSRIFIAHLIPGDTAVRLVKIQLKGIVYPSPFSTLGATKAAIIIIPFSRHKSRQKGQNIAFWSKSCKHHELFYKAEMPSRLRI
jgi:hypothetical protein